MADDNKPEGTKAKAWAADEKVEVLMYMLDLFAPKFEWKKLENIPNGRTLKAVQIMYQREKARYKKTDEGEGVKDTNDPKTTSDAELKKTKAKATPRKTAPALKQDSDEGSGFTKKTKSSGKAKPALNTIGEDNTSEKSGDEAAAASETKTKAKTPRKPRAKKSDGEDGEKITKKRKGSAKDNKADSGVDELPVKKVKSSET